jgi:hypothetical protein
MMCLGAYLEADLHKICTRSDNGASADRKGGRFRQHKNKSPQYWVIDWILGLQRKLTSNFLSLEM